MNGRNRTPFLRLGLVALVALLALGAASAPALAQGSTLTIDPNGSVGSGVATVSGTFTTPPAFAWTRVEVRVVQLRHGQVVVSAFADVGPIAATGSTQNWTATMFSPAGFKPGHVQVTARLIRDTFNGPLELAVAGATVKLNPN